MRVVWGSPVRHDVRVALVLLLGQAQANLRVARPDASATRVELLGHGDHALAQRVGVDELEVHNEVRQAGLCGRIVGDLGSPDGPQLAFHRLVRLVPDVGGSGQQRARGAEDQGRVGSLDLLRLGVSALDGFPLVGVGRVVGLREGCGGLEGRGWSGCVG